MEIAKVTVTSPHSSQTRSAHSLSGNRIPCDCSNLQKGLFTTPIFPACSKAVFGVMGSTGAWELDKPVFKSWLYFLVMDFCISSSPTEPQLSHCDIELVLLVYHSCGVRITEVSCRSCWCYSFLPIPSSQKNPSPSQRWQGLYWLRAWPMKSNYLGVNPSITAN